MRESHQLRQTQRQANPSHSHESSSISMALESEEFTYENSIDSEIESEIEIQLPSLSLSNESSIINRWSVTDMFQRLIVESKATHRITYKASSMIFGGFVDILKTMADSNLVLNDEDLVKLEQLSKSHYEQKMLMDSFDGYVKPKTVLLENFKYEYVSLRESLEKIFENESTCNALFNDTTGTANTLKIYDNQEYLNIELYVDDFQRSNALRHTHLVTCVYFTINNLPINLSCTRSEINLLMVCEGKHLKSIHV